MALDAIFFDLDGTLVDTNSMHVEAWRRALQRHGYTVAPDRVSQEMGKGGDQLVPALLGKSADERDGEALRKAQPEEFEKLAAADGIVVFPKARELLEAVRAQGLRRVLATSSGKSQLAVIEKYAGWKVSDQMDLIVNADDIEKSKPAPDLVLVAVQKTKLSPAQCAMVGDTPFDATAALHGGVVCLGVTCGGREAKDLYAAGARKVWEGPGDLLQHLDEALRVASPGSGKLTFAAMESLMAAALEMAERGMAEGEAPIGAVIARGDGTIIARSFNATNQTQNKTAHAEVMAFAAAAGKCPLDCRDLILVSTLEPCVMCTGAAMEAAVDTIVYGLKAPADSGTGRVRPPDSPESQMPRIVGDILADRSRELFERWLKRNSNSPQAAYVKQLLKLNANDQRE